MKFKKIIAGTILLASSLLALSSCSKEEKVYDIYDFHTEEQANYLAEADPNLFTKYAKANEEKTASKAIRINLEKTNIEDSITVVKASDNTTVFESTGGVEYIDIFNLELNTVYSILINKEESYSFKTSDTGLRNLNIDGVVNIRDIGGWHDTDGKMLKQGLIYRSARFSEDETGEKTISSQGVYSLVNMLGMKSEIDLRTIEDSGGITESPLGNSVSYFAVPMKSGGNIITLNKDKIKDFFKILGDEKNYPVVMHCSIGTDRTGCMACILEALLGVAKEDITRDYLFSNFSNIERLRTSSTIKDYLNIFETAKGNNLAEKTYNYLTSIGVSSADLDTVIRLMK